MKEVTEKPLWIPCKYGDKLEEGHYMVKIDNGIFQSVIYMVINKFEKNVYFFNATECFKIQFPEE